MMMNALFTSLPHFTRSVRSLDEARTSYLDELLSEHAFAVAEVQAALDVLSEGPDARAARTVDEGVRNLLGRLRSEDRQTASGRLDDLLASDGLELLDVESVPRSLKRVGMRMLNQLNLATGAYPNWKRALEAVLPEGGHVYDLAAGTGGFALWLAERSENLRLTSSDLREEYVRIGEKWAAERNLDVRFETRDALRLDEISEPVDLFLSTQGSHHLGPVLLTRMIHQAARKARKGVFIVDLYRSPESFLAACTIAFTPLALIAGDGAQSVRRSWQPAEMRLFAHLAGATVVSCEPIGTVHLGLHAVRAEHSSNE